MQVMAAVLFETGQPLRVIELDLPRLAEGQVLVEIAFSGVCHTQVLEARGYRGEDKWLPHCMGHEGTGTVVDVGSGVTRVRPGDRVVLSWIKGPGLEAGGAKYTANGQTVNAGGVTTFQSHAVVSENRVSALPDGLSMKSGVLLGCAAPTGMGSVLNSAGLRQGETVAVFGVGGIGLHACLAAAGAGADCVIAVDPNPRRRDLAQTFGANELIDPDQQEPREAILSSVPGGVDVAVVATGKTEVMALAMDCIRGQGGRAVVLGNARDGETVMLSPAHLNQGKSMLGSWGGDADPQRDFPRFADILAAADIDTATLLSKPYALSQINQALDDLERGEVGRPLIELARS